MNPAEAEVWKSFALDQIFEAIAESAPLSGALVYKGARVLRLLLADGRQSFDIDSNLRKGFDEVEQTLAAIVARFERDGILPFEFPLP